MPNCFVYGTLKKGFPNDPILKGIRFEKGHVIDYEMYGKTYYYPFVMKGKGIVHGEIYYNVPKITITELDILEGHPNFYKREQCIVHTESGETAAWIYLNPESAREHGGKIKSGNWLETKSFYK